MSGRKISNFELEKNIFFNCNLENAKKSFQRLILSCVIFLLFYKNCPKKFCFSFLGNGIIRCCKCKTNVRLT